MTRRTFLVALPAAAALLAWRSPMVEAAQDLEWVRAWERAQRDRPKTLTARARIVPAAEPGTPLVIHGRLFARDGRTPLPDVTVFAYHTDRHGRYDEPANGPHSWRLRGWARSGADGRFTFDTIRPGVYPNRTTPAHVHVTIDGPTLLRRWTPELNFADDTLVGREARAASAAAGVFGPVRPVEVRDGVHHVEFTLRVVDEGRF